MDYDIYIEIAARRGLTWSRAKWPMEIGVKVIPHPFDQFSNLLADETMTP